MCEWAYAVFIMEHHSIQTFSARGQEKKKKKSSLIYCHCRFNVTQRNFHPFVILTVEGPRAVFQLHQSRSCCPGLSQTSSQRPPFRQFPLLTSPDRNITPQIWPSESFFFLSTKSTRKNKSLKCFFFPSSNEGRDTFLQLGPSDICNRSFHFLLPHVFHWTMKSLYSGASPRKSGTKQDTVFFFAL